MDRAVRLSTRNRVNQHHTHPINMKETNKIRKRHWIKRYNNAIDL